jgi:dTMP kinase
MAGVFITFEGGEGSGKSTQLSALLAYLRSTGREALETCDPGGTAIGDQIRRTLLDRGNAGMDAMAELLLYEASRAQLVREVICPALLAGRIVLCDRFTDSTTAYQGYGRGLDLALIARLNALAADGLCPDLTLLLDLDPAVGLFRAGGRQREDRIEAEVLAFHQRVHRGYQAIAAGEPQRVARLDAFRGVRELSVEVSRRVEKLLTASDRCVSRGGAASG